MAEKTTSMYDINEDAMISLSELVLRERKLKKKAYQKYYYRTVTRPNRRKNKHNPKTYSVVTTSFDHKTDLGETGVINTQNQVVEHLKCELIEMRNRLDQLEERQFDVVGDGEGGKGVNIHFYPIEIQKSPEEVTKEELLKLKQNAMTAICKDVAVANDRGLFYLFSAVMNTEIACRRQAMGFLVELCVQYGRLELAKGLNEVKSQSISAMDNFLEKECLKFRNVNISEDS